jgi:hypothetical protein
MRILEWIDADRRDSESAGDAPILEALIGDGHRLVRLVPGGGEEDPSSAQVPDQAALKRIDWRAPSRWSEPSAVRALCGELEGRGLDAIWARGRGVWSSANAVANRLLVPLWIELGSAEEARATRAIRGLADFVVTVPCPAFATLLHPRFRDHLLSCEPRERAAGSGRVPLTVPPPIAFRSTQTVPPSLTTDGPIPSADSEPTPRAIVLLAGDEPSRSSAAFDRLLRALSRIARDATLPFELFLEEPLGDRAAAARSLTARRLADRVTRLPPLSRCRGVLGPEAILVAHSPLGRLEPGLIEALARGSRFVGVGGPALRGWFVDGREGRLLGPRGEVSLWETAIRDAISAKPPSHATAGLARWLAPSARIDAVRSSLRRLQGPHAGRVFSGAFKAAVS